MKIILINPYELGRQPFGLAEPAAWLERDGCTVNCCDLSIQKLEDCLEPDTELVAIYIAMHTATRIAVEALPKIRQLAHGENQPENIKRANAVDFKLADEVRRAQRQAQAEATRLEHVIIVSGDGDFVHMARDLVNDGVHVQIWSGSDAMSSKFAGIVGEDNVVILDDVIVW